MEIYPTDFVRKPDKSGHIHCFKAMSLRINYNILEASDQSLKASAFFESSLQSIVLSKESKQQLR